LNLDHPLIASVLVPLALALALTAALRFTLGAQGREPLAAAAVGLALLVTHLLTFGAPVWPPQSGVQKLPLLFALLLAGGLAVDLLRPGRWVVGVAAMAAVAAMALWLAWPQLRGADLAIVLVLVPAALLGLAGLAGLVHAPAEGADRATVLVLSALATAGASFHAGSLVLFQVALSLAAVVGGFALWNWPRPRLPFAASAVAVGGLGLFAVALLLLLLTSIRPWALLPIPLVFGAGALARHLPVPAPLSRATIGPLYIAAMGLIPVVATILLAQAPSAPDDLYYR
jgi:hypothetical protein